VTLDLGKTNSVEWVNVQVADVPKFADVARRSLAQIVSIKCS
jgi:hypothetical protein